jgi:hypothetical protein
LTTSTTTTQTTITLTTTTLNPTPTFPFFFEDPKALEEAYDIVHHVLDSHCFPEDILDRAFFDDRLRLRGNNGDVVVWDGSAAPTDVEFPVHLYIWLDLSERGAKDNCTVSTLHATVSSAYMMATATWALFASLVAHVGSWA